LSPLSQGVHLREAICLQQNLGNPFPPPEKAPSIDCVNAFNSKIVTEEELLRFLDDGWELVQQLANGKLPCTNRLQLVVIDCCHAHTSHHHTGVSAWTKVHLTAKGCAPPQKRAALRSFFFSRAFATFLSLPAVHAFLAPLLLFPAIH